MKYKVIFYAIWAAALATAILLAYDGLASGVGYEPEQPVEFSHKVHAGDFKIKCVYCHYNAEKGAAASVPTAFDCQVCHIALKYEKETMIPVNESFDENKPLQWTKVYVLPDYARFNHSRHLRVQIDCSSCHGETETMERIRRVRDLSMKWCLDCHRDPRKYVVVVREISGVLSNIPDVGAKEYLFGGYKPESVVEPAYGLYFHRPAEPLLPGIPAPRKPTLGPDDCAACHY